MKAMLLQAGQRAGMIAMVLAAGIARADHTEYTVQLSGGAPSASFTTSVPKATGELFEIDFDFDLKASYSYSITNSGSAPESALVSIQSYVDFSVTEPITGKVVAGGLADASDPAVVNLDPGETFSSSGFNELGPRDIEYYDYDLIFPYLLATSPTDTLTVKMDYVNSVTVTPTGDLAPPISSFWDRANVTAVYDTHYVPSPSAPITMLICLGGNVVRRRARLRKTRGPAHV